MLRLGLLIPLVEVCLRCVGLKRTQRALMSLASTLNRRHKKPLSSACAQQLACALDHANHHYSIYQATCLTRSLALLFLLARRGAAADVCLGVRTFTGRFEAHAWIEYNGIALNEAVPPRDIYTVFDWTQSTAVRPLQ